MLDIPQPNLLNHQHAFHKGVYAWAGTEIGIFSRGWCVERNRIARTAFDKFGMHDHISIAIFEKARSFARFQGIIDHPHL